MTIYKATLQYQTNGKGLYDITSEVRAEMNKSGVQDGLCTLFIPHTSASLILSENWDPTARNDLEEFMDRLVPEGQPWFEHTQEGPDDSPSHMRSMLTKSSETIPVDNGSLTLGSWQGIYLFEHRTRPHARKLFVRILGE
jgi:secondary thiamine-phosphate synthase enzyme